ncbi:hypothetical protein IJI91_00350 [Candidatus Saccharibacteria bacterium]|nr:hypothetical protein [Candidatus Saccharibacteria bacterium]
MKNILDAFEKSGPIDVSKIGSRRQVFEQNARITRQGRMFVPIVGSDEFFLVRGTIIEDGRKIIAISKTSDDNTSALKSSAKTAGTPFINIRNLCKLWFGDDCEKWRKNLQHICSHKGVDLYEVVEENYGKNSSAKTKKWSDEVIGYIKENNMIDFSLEDIKKFEPKLKINHPDNKDIYSTVRKVLQNLRDAGLITFKGNGQYRIAPKFITEYYLHRN